MKVGFTGTRGGLTDAQRATIARLLIRVHEAHHGDCIGADEQFHRLCRDAAVPVVIHPPINAGRRAFCSGGHVLEPDDYLPRNRAIVDSTELLIGAPFEREEPAPARGQGTWSTIRYARRQGGAVVVVWPDGSMFETAGKTPRFAGGSPPAPLE